MRWFFGQLRLGHWVIVGSLATPAIFPNGQLFLRPSLLTIQGWMLGIVGFSPVCGVLLEHAHEVWRQEAKSADHTDLIHQGWRVLVGALRAPLWSCSLDHLNQTLQDDNAAQYNRVLNCEKSCVSGLSGMDDLQQRSTVSFYKFGLSKCEKNFWPRLWKTFSWNSAEPPPPSKTHICVEKKIQATWKILLTWRVLTPQLKSRSKQ